MMRSCQAKEPGAHTVGQPDADLGWEPGSSDEILPLLITCLADPCASVRANAARSLARIGVCSQPVVDGLKKAALDEDIDARCAASAALEGFGLKEPNR